MKDIFQEIKWKNVLCFATVAVIFVAAIYCCNAEVGEVCAEVVTNSSSIENYGNGKCRQCGRQLKHKGYFCNENCRENYTNEYHAERYGNAICRGCGKEFIKPTASSYFCSPQCQYDYYEDLKLVTEVEEYRTQGQAQKVEAQ